MTEEEIMDKLPQLVAEKTGGQVRHTELCRDGVGIVLKDPAVRSEYGPPSWYWAIRELPRQCGMRVLTNGAQFTVRDNRINEAMLLWSFKLAVDYLQNKAVMAILTATERETPMYFKVAEYFSMPLIATGDNPNTGNKVFSWLVPIMSNRVYSPLMDHQE
jgi:hypothetical protein